MMRNLHVLVRHDLAVAFKSKSLFLLCFIPLLVSASLAWVDYSDGKFPVSRIALISGGSYPPTMVSSVESAKGLFAVNWIATVEEGREKLKNKMIDGVILPSETGVRGGDLLVSRKESIQTVAILQGVTALQKATLGAYVDWVGAIQSLTEGGLQQQSLPTWVLMTSLLVGLIILPTQIAEEKEKRQILGLFQTPLREREWLMSKLVMGMLLTVAAAALFHVLTRVPIKNWIGYVSFLGLGSFYFSSVGILMSLLCRTQASARAFGVVLYLPHLMPSALADFSQRMNTLAQFVPSYQFYEPLKGFLLIGSGVNLFYGQAIYLFVAGGVCSGIAYLLLKRRWRIQ